MVKQFVVLDADGVAHAIRSMGDGPNNGKSVHTVCEKSHEACGEPAYLRKGPVTCLTCIDESTYTDEENG